MNVGIRGKGPSKYDFQLDLVCTKAGIRPEHFFPYLNYVRYYEASFPLFERYLVRLNSGHYKNELGSEICSSFVVCLVCLHREDLVIIHGLLLSNLATSSLIILSLLSLCSPGISAHNIPKVK